MRLTTETNDWTPIDPNLENELLNAYERIAELEGKTTTDYSAFAITGLDILRKSFISIEKYEEYTSSGRYTPEQLKDAGVKVVGKIQLVVK